MEVEARNSLSLCQIYYPIVIRATHTNFKMFHSELICSAASDYHEKNEVKDVLGQNFWLGCLSNFRKLPRIWVASSKTPMGEFIFHKCYRPQSCNFTEAWVPLCKFFKSVSRITGKLKHSRIGDLKALTSLLGSCMLR